MERHKTRILGNGNDTSFAAEYAYFMFCTVRYAAYSPAVGQSFWGQVDVALSPLTSGPPLALIEIGPSAALLLLE